MRGGNEGNERDMEGGEDMDGGVGDEEVTGGEMEGSDGL